MQSLPTLNESTSEQENVLDGERPGPATAAAVLQDTLMPHDQSRLVVKGAREHNLRNVDLDLPRDAMIVFTGLSGSGKSSLAFDTIFAEGQRRYVESLSAYARQFLGQVDKPDVDFIEGLSPAVSIDQKSTSKNPRSTVGTITEIYDYMRLLWARVGRPHCPICHEPVTRQTPQQIVDQLLEMPEGTRFQLLAPVVRGRKGEFVDLFKELAAKGYSRARVDGSLVQLSEPPKLGKQFKHTIEVVVDRLVVKEGIRQRLADSVETALGLAEGRVLADFVDLDEDDDVRLRAFSEHLACPNEHPLAIDEIEPRSFSFNNPFGACPACTGIGTKLEVDVDLVVPDTQLSLSEGVIAPWSLGTATQEYWTRLLAGLADDLGFSMTTPWHSLPEYARDAVLYGKDHKVVVQYRNRFGRERKYSTGFEGAIAYIQRKHLETESDSARDRYEEYMREIPCPECGGARLNPASLSVLVGGRSIADVSRLPLQEARTFLATLELTRREEQIAAQVLKEIDARLRFLLDVGLEYLNLERAAGTLSGGEAQRIRLATQIGSGLVGVLYVLDEPSIGLHQRDNRRLIETLTRLRDLGNTLIVVEHDEDTIHEADWIVDIGPGAGEHGGEVVHSGTLEDLKANTASLTGDYLSGRRSIEVPAKRRKVDRKRQLKIVGAREHNLQGVDVTFPLGVLTAVTGVSGSGKSTLVNDILYKVLANRLNGAKQVAGRHTRIEGLEHLDKVIHVDQSPIGRTPRSNPATYTGVFDHIRKLFAETNEAKVRGYMPGRFSFNVKGGRCEACSGDGTLKIEMNFLPDVYVPCEVCHGARYNRETLEVHYKGKTIADVLSMPIDEAAEFFAAFSPIARHLNTLVDVGLGYVRLGQPATTLSGGEAQRVKLAAELQKRSNGRSAYVLDEPTTGLHFEDIRKLLLVLQSLVEKGNTVITIEHNLDVIKSADWIIDLGPNGGSGGGRIVATGTPEQVSRAEGSYTGMFLAEILGSEG
ncbi:excinuclease ABC subunit A [Sinomonas atrocyanea]|uniref:UvrABC system protein A n=2 Tax=Sinomonas atrocyanea TaxID=37927 RepID=A0A127A0H3_9MICC|nr:excinuclease ABC subunit A [Sinomonas atrocyanea]GEB62663.1 UvrABC system protein A [Sinomonas atrocyanea]GGG54305.1 UvrABC system protein A [Sinomonas atrocyanea]